MRTDMPDWNLLCNVFDCMGSRIYVRDKGGWRNKVQGTEVW